MVDLNEMQAALNRAFQNLIDANKIERHIHWTDSSPRTVQGVQESADALDSRLRDLPPEGQE